MKKKLCIFILCCCFVFPTSIHAQSNVLLLRSTQLPYLFLVDSSSTGNLKVILIPSDLYLANANATLLSLKKESTEEIQKRIHQNYQKEIDHYLELDLDKLSEDFDLPLTNYNMKYLDGISAYFEAINKKLTTSDLIHYQRYIQSDLGLGDYYHYYQMFQSTVDITYVYADYFEVNTHKYPMDYFQ